jgi:hypothetical protein
MPAPAELADMRPATNSVSVIINPRRVGDTEHIRGVLLSRCAINP